MREDIKYNLGRLLLAFATILLVLLLIEYLKLVEYNWVTILFGLPIFTYLIMVLIVGLIKTITEKRLV